MIINKNSWHYKAWRWTYDRAYEVPSSTNLCPYMRRIMFLVPIKAFIRTIVTFVSMTCLAIVAGIRWCFGYKTVSTDWDRSPVEYAGLPVAGREIYPWHVLVPAAAITAEVLVQRSAGWAGFGIINGLILGCIALVVLGVWIFCADSTQIFRDWIDAGHRKICPAIDFGDHYDAQLPTEKEETPCDCELCQDNDEAEEDDEVEEEPDTVEDLINKAGSGPEETVAVPNVETPPATGETK